MIDLHMHSTASDGLLSPEDLVHQAVKTGLTTISLTDHDTIDGIPAAVQAAQVAGITLLSGVELSVAMGDYRDVHMLGYGIDGANHTLTTALHAFADARAQRSGAILDRINQRLTEEGRQTLSPQEVTQQAAGVLGRPHIGRALMARGYVSSMEEAFTLYLRPCNVPKYYWDWREALQTIHAAGGIAVLAHPVTITRNLDELQTLVDQMAHGGLDGVEVFNSTALEHEAQYLQNCALSRGLVITAGSDFHGEEGPVRLGYGRSGMRFSEALMPPILERLQRYN